MKHAIIVFVISSLFVCVAYTSVKAQKTNSQTFSIKGGINFSNQMLMQLTSKGRSIPKTTTSSIQELLPVQVLIWEQLTLVHGIHME